MNALEQRVDSLIDVAPELHTEEFARQALAMLFEVSDALARVGRLEEALREVLDLLTGWTAPMSASERLEGIGRVARAALAGVETRPRRVFAPSGAMCKFSPNDPVWTGAICACGPMECKAGCA